MSRLASLFPEDLDGQQREVYDAIAGGQRATGRQLFELIGADGTLNGPFGVMLHAPSVGLPLQELGSAIRYRTSMTDRAREVAILLTATATASEFEWYAHERVGRAVGLNDQELAHLRQGRFPSEDPVEQAVAQLSSALLAGTEGRLDDATYEGLRTVLGETQIIELTTLVGYYRTLAQLMGIFAVGVPTGEVQGRGAATRR